MSLSAMPVESLRGVGPQTAKALRRLGLRTIEQLCFHLPRRYEDRSRIVPIARLNAGQPAVVQGVIQETRVRTGRQRYLQLRLVDDTGWALLRFFNYRQLPGTFTEGEMLRCYGEPRYGPPFHFFQPEILPLDQPLGDGTLTPVYTTTEGVTQKTLRQIIFQALAHYRLVGEGQGSSCTALLPDFLPHSWLTPYGLPSLAEALQALHFPPADSDVGRLLSGRSAPRRRLAFEELLAHHLYRRRIRQHYAARHAPVLTDRQGLVERLVGALPFALTGAQQKVWQTISADLAAPVAMRRMLQGDVGSGKTLIAMMAAAQAVSAGAQAVVMAPTEILAEQHYQAFRELLCPVGATLTVLHGSLTARERADRLTGLADGRIQIAVGTHALFQKEVRFARLALVIIDEQHRFGVRQRMALLEKGRLSQGAAHLLIMTATPIPRTLAMSVYADLDVSTIDELPPGRTPVETAVIGDHRRDEIVRRIRAACSAGRQVYWVCPLIDESETLDLQTLDETFRRLTAELPELRIDVVHGRMGREKKQQVMRRFKEGRVDILVATTVIEVGVDVPNASVMIIENAERLGLAQLHQLRGRVGRGAVKSACVLLYKAPLSEAGRARLEIMRATCDGFELARRDLAMRGPGELFGTRQSGDLAFKVADLREDHDMVPAVSECALRLEREAPQGIEPLIGRWLESPSVTLAG